MRSYTPVRADEHDDRDMVRYDEEPAPPWRRTSDVIPLRLTDSQKRRMRKKTLEANFRSRFDESLVSTRDVPTSALLGIPYIEKDRELAFFLQDRISRDSEAWQYLVQTNTSSASSSTIPRVASFVRALEDERECLQRRDRRRPLVRPKDEPRADYDDHYQPQRSPTRPRSRKRTIEQVHREPSPSQSLYFADDRGDEEEPRESKKKKKKRKHC